MHSQLCMFQRIIWDSFDGADYSATSTSIKISKRIASQKGDKNAYKLRPEDREGGLEQTIY